ncbi:5'-nucleotidase SurE [Propionispora sp. 2/2-37]|uniref:5'/3'-nucleotidase SurE n=1 Tax=Propionispora sp. 2/2-37 TaxID=1677858 RepID=UPI0006BB956D|nr:5'/3'-nucleotidase SurE [Propionispora sp. 2/2-37]CUH94245.1 5'-nucleotidase SurE [Propionispora sp. 2/2-37]
MRILLTNDDGIHAAGIQALVKEFMHNADIAVVAPDEERSATSQAITVRHPIYVDEYSFPGTSVQGWKVGGTPTDCVKIALETDRITKPDIIVSGINHGPNMGTDVLYSGTVSAAIEGALHGIPAIAVSLDGRNDFDFAAAAKFAVTLAQTLYTNPLPPRTLLNVNVPALPESEIMGVAVTKLGRREYENTFQPRKDPRGRTYYWMGGNILECENDPDSDIITVAAGKISVTPIHFDLTNYTIMDTVKQWNL